MHENEEEDYELDKFEYDYYSKIKENQIEPDPHFNENWEEVRIMKQDLIFMIKEKQIPEDKHNYLIEKYGLKCSIYNHLWL